MFQFTRDSGVAVTPGLAVRVSSAAKLSRSPSANTGGFLLDLQLSEARIEAKVRQVRLAIELTNGRRGFDDGQGSIAPARHRRDSRSPARNRPPGRRERLIRLKDAP